MKIVHVLNNFLPYTTGGIEIYVWSLSKQLQKLGYDISILIPNYGKNITDSYTYDNLSVNRYAEPTLVDRNLIFGNTKPSGLKSFLNYLNSDLPDVIHFHHIAGSNGITAEHLRLAATLPVKIIFTAHLAGQTCFTGNQLFCGKYYCDGKIQIAKCTYCFNYSKKLGLLTLPMTFISTLFYKLNLKVNGKLRFNTLLNIPTQVNKKKKDLQIIIDSCHDIIAISKWYYHSLIENNVPLKKLKFLPQALPNCTSHNYVIEEKQKQKNPLRLLFVGRIIAEKGLHILIDALLTLKSDKYELDIYGPTADSKYEQDLKVKCKDFRNIQWKGVVSHDIVIQLMRSYDLLCVCSIINEMSPLVIQESFAVGLPVLASNVPGNKELITHQVNGLLFENRCFKSLKTQLIHCYNSQSILREIKKNLKATYSSSDLAISYDSIYKS